jgi:hypothetical protein
MYPLCEAHLLLRPWLLPLPAAAAGPLRESFEENRPGTGHPSHRQTAADAPIHYLLHAHQVPAGHDPLLQAAAGQL